MAQEKEHEDSPLLKHDILHHGGKRTTYSMRVERQHRSALTRQVHESTVIQHSKCDILLNSKGEWNGPRIPRISIEVGDRTISQEYSGQGLGQTTVTTNQDNKQNNKLTPDDKERDRVQKWEDDARIKARLLISSMGHKRKDKDRQQGAGQDDQVNKVARRTGPDLDLGEILTPSQTQATNGKTTTLPAAKVQDAKTEDRDRSCRSKEQRTDLERLQDNTSNTAGLVHHHPLSPSTLKVEGQGSLGGQHASTGQDDAKDKDRAQDQDNKRLKPGPGLHRFQSTDIRYRDATMDLMRAAAGSMRPKKKGVKSKPKDPRTPGPHKPSASQERSPDDGAPKAACVGQKMLNKMDYFTTTGGGVKVSGAQGEKEKVKS